MIEQFEQWKRWFLSWKVKKIAYGETKNLQFAQFFVAEIRDIFLYFQEKNFLKINEISWCHTGLDCNKNSAKPH